MSLDAAGEHRSRTSYLLSGSAIRLFDLLRFCLCGDRRVTRCIGETNTPGMYPLVVPRTPRGGASLGRSDYLCYLVTQIGLSEICSCRDCAGHGRSVVVAPRRTQPLFAIRVPRFLSPRHSLARLVRTIHTTT